MQRRQLMRPVVPVAAALATLLLAAGCGDVEITAEEDPAPTEDTTSAAATDVDTSAGEGDWLLAMTTAGGADAETSTTVYLTYNPSTGEAKATELPPVKAAGSSPEQAALLISADRRWAIPDTTVAAADQKSGQAKIYAVADGTAKVIDIREQTANDVEPVAWAFDPNSADTMRTVDTKNRVWVLSVAGGKATQEGTLPSDGWVFTNGFNASTGEPWVESISSDETRPPGNGPSDSSPVTREGGTVLSAGSSGLSELPASPCRLGAGFTDAAGVTWTFCADEPSVSAYYLPEGGTEWTAYGKPSPAVAPVAAGFPLVLPPAE